jgi:hypothetical protein
MIQIEYLPIVLTGVGLIVSILYYSMVLRNANRTRQAQLLMNLYESYRSKESRLESLEIHSWKWKDMDDFWEKYGQPNNPEAWATWETKAAFFNGVGILLKRNLIDIKLLDDLLTNSLIRHWNSLGMGPILVDWRKRVSIRRQQTKWRHDPEFSGDKGVNHMGTSFLGFDYLYHSLMKYRETHPPEFT